MVEGPPTFKPEPWYNHWGDSIVYKLVDEAHYAERVDDLLTIYRSLEDKRPIGFQIKGVEALLKKLGVNCLEVASQQDGRSVKKISVRAVLLAAFSDEVHAAPLLDRAEAYAAIMPASDKTIQAYAN